MFISFIRSKILALTIIVVSGLSFCTVLTAPPAYAQSARNLAGSAVPWHLSADRIKYDKTTDEYTAIGDVLIIHGNERLSADRVRFNRGTMIAHAKGHVRLISGKDRLNGDRMDINLSKETGTLYNGIIFIEQKHFYIRGKKIVKTGRTTYKINEASLTSCDGKVPAWHISGRKLNVTLDGYGTVKGAAFWVKKFPILYMPYFIFPAKSKRQSGFLAPQIGQSNRLGMWFTLPYFWAINRSTDATFYLSPMQYRGVKLGVEYRYVESDQSRGTLMLDGFNDQKIDNGIGDSSSKWGYTDVPYLRPNRLRYWIRGKANQALFDGLSAKLDFDVVSDQDYLREFSSGYMGYNETRNYFMNTFGRDIDDRNDAIRTNQLNLNRAWTHYTLNTDLLWYDNANRGHKTADNPLQKLPDIMFDALRQPVPGTPLYSSMNSEYTYLYRKGGLTGHRIDLHPELYLPYRIGHYGTFEPHAGFHETAWYLDSSREMRPEDARYYHREMYDLGAELSSSLYRVFPVDFGSIKKIQHMMIPKIDYDYVPRTNQSMYPYFDNVDRIPAENQVTFSLTQLLTSKRTILSPQKSSPRYVYNQFCRFFVSQSFDFGEITDPTQVKNPLNVQLDITPESLITLHADAQWQNARRLEYSLLSFNINDLRNDQFGVNYTYTKNFIQSVGISFNVPIGGSFRIMGNYNQNIKTNETTMFTLGLQYTAKCWSLDLVHVDQQRDHRFEGMIVLTGLGGIGNTPQSR